MYFICSQLNNVWNKLQKLIQSEKQKNRKYLNSYGALLQLSVLSHRIQCKTKLDFLKVNGWGDNRIEGVLDYNVFLASVVLVQ